MDVLILMQGMVPIPGHPVTGNGLRAHALAEGLACHGHRVRLATRAIDADAVDPALLPAETLRYDDASSIPDLIAGSAAEAVLVCHAELLEQLPDPSPVPVIADLYGPRLVEAQFERADLDREGARFVEQLRRADAFLVATERQRWFALPWLMLAGFDCRKPPVLVVPLSANPRPPLRFHRKPVADLTFVTGGVFWPWRESEAPLTRLLGVLERAGRGHVQLFGGSYPLATEANVTYRDPRATVAPHPRLRFQGMVAYDRLFEHYARAQVAFDVMEPNAERELSFSFRVIDYLAASLPVVTNRFTEIAAVIEASEAGWCVDVEAPGELEQTLERILADPGEVARRGANARRLVETRYAWDRTVEPLDRYLRAPTRAARGASVLGTLVQVAGEAYRAREDRLREIERSRQAVRRAEELDQALAALRQADAERANEASLMRAELEARSRDLESLKEQAAAWRRDGAVQAAELDGLRETVARKQRQVEETIELRDRARREAEALTHRLDALEQAVRHHEKVGRELEAERERLAREADALRAERDREREREQERVAEGLERREQARRESEALAHRVATLEQELRHHEKRVRELDVERERAVREADGLRAERDRERERVVEGLERREQARRESEALAHRIETLEQELRHHEKRIRELDAERERAAREADATCVERDRERARVAELVGSLREATDSTREARAARDQLEDELRGVRAQAEHRVEQLRDAIAHRDTEAQRHKAALAEAEHERERGAEERKQLALQLERVDAKAVEAERRLEHAREQLAARELEVARARGVAADAERERDRLAQESQALTRARDALEAKAHQLEQRLEARGAEIEELARQVATLRGEIEVRTAEIARKHAELEAATRERDHERSRGAARDEEIRKLKDLVSDRERERDRAHADAQDLRVRVETLTRDLHEAGVAARAQTERAAHELESTRAALTHEREARGSAETALEGLRTEAHEARARHQGELERLAHELATRDRDLAWYRTEAESKERALCEARERASQDRANADALAHALAAHDDAQRALEAELRRLKATPMLRLWLRLWGRRTERDDAPGIASPVTTPPPPTERDR
ncbi:MAG: glycosyltransferase [bacterium]